MKRTPSQLAAILSPAHQILVLAGPGSGKTSTVIARLERILEEGVRPGEIAAITFTNAAAREIEARLGASRRLGYCGTLHGFALRCLRKHGGAAGYGERISVINQEGAEALLASANRTVAAGKISMKKLLEAKAAGIPEKPSAVPDLVVAHYLKTIRDAGIVDFDVILTEFARLLEAERGFTNLGIGVAGDFSHVFVDEIQDSAPVDWRIYRALPIANKFLVGDPDQSIYGFRGASVEETLLAAESGDWEVHKLEENFRSFTAITDAAQRLIEHNLERVPKRTVSAKGVGGRAAAAELANAGEESARIAALIKMEMIGRKPEEIAVLTRTNSVAMELGKALAALDVPVAVRADPELPRDLPVARALAAYLCNPDNDTLGFIYTLAIDRDRTGTDGRAHEILQEAKALRKSLNAHAYGFPHGLPAAEFSAVASRSGISRESIMFAAEKLRDLPPEAPMIELAAALGAGAEFDSARTLAQNGVRVLTVHSAKGLEFDTVFLAGFEDETIPGRRKDVDLEEERRLAYVGITRAKRILQFTSAKVRETKWSGLEKRSPSRFIAEALTKKPQPVASP